MNIIFKDDIAELDEKYTVLELDTFRLPDGSQHTAYCVVENIPIQELPQVSSLRELHANLIKNYGEKNWNFCEQAIEHLTGKWGGEADSFYAELQTRIQKFKDMELEATWSPIITK